MGAYEADRFPHIKVECALIENALKRNLPVLGICLGAQLLAHTLGAPVRKHTERELGWCDLENLETGEKDRLLENFQPREKIFQMHGDTFDLPAGATLLASSKTCPTQAFRYGDKTYGLQFHLEVTQAMIEDFLAVEKNIQDLIAWGGEKLPEKIRSESPQFLLRSLSLANTSFAKFLENFGLPERVEKVRHSHGHDR
jgi:GMP synthase (glutamine-hydrolysing)